MYCSVYPAPPAPVLPTVCLLSWRSATSCSKWITHVWPWSRWTGQKHGSGQRVSEISAFKAPFFYHPQLNFGQIIRSSVCLCFFSSHIMEHLDGVIDKPEKDMTPQELQLHYFKMHDYDGNNLLDGLELATAITHVHREVQSQLSFKWKHLSDRAFLE